VTEKLAAADTPKIVFIMRTFVANYKDFYFHFVFFLPSSILGVLVVCEKRLLASSCLSVLPSVRMDYLDSQ
jgi:hypothetical protein